MDEREREQLFELWKRGAPFPELVATVNSLIQDAATRNGEEGKAFENRVEMDS